MTTTNAALLADIRLAADTLRAGVVLSGRFGSIALIDGRLYHSADGLRAVVYNLPMTALQVLILRYGLDIPAMVAAAKVAQS